LERIDSLRKTPTLKICFVGAKVKKPGSRASRPPATKSCAKMFLLSKLKTMLILQVIIYAVGAIAIILTILPFLKFGMWWIRIGEFPRLQIAFLCLATAILFLILAVFPLHPIETAFLTSLIASALYQLYCVLPYLPIYLKQVEKCRSPLPENTIRLLIFNVFIENRQSAKLLRLVEEVDPDLVLLAEPDERWVREVSALEKKYPYTVLHPLDNAYGMALYSRFELENPKLNFFIEDDIPSITSGVKLKSGEVINLYCLHPRPPVPTESVRSNERDAELLFVGRMIKEQDAPTIVAGDLNDVAWSRTTKLFQKISGLLDPRRGRGLYTSFHASYPMLRFPLDHVFHSNHFRLAELRRLPSIGSDHFPIFIALSYEKTAEITQKEPVATPEEEREAIETIVETLKMIEEEEAEVRTEK
jgi:endonuclease/exonuclease/phosphatase (EEP) superfamily protein YafD